MVKYIKFLFFLLIISSTVNGQTTVIKAGHFYDSRNGKMLENQILVIQDGKIKEVGTNPSYAKTDRIIDLSDSWVLPGLMDCHVHITFNLPYLQRSSLTKNYVIESNALRAIRGTMVAKQFLYNGFTTIKEIGNDGDYATADIIKAIDKGWIEGPTIIYAGKIIAPFGGQSKDVAPDHEGIWKFEYIDADTPDEIKKAVRKNRYYGATVIKLVTEDNGIYDEEEIKAAVDEAKKYGMKVTVHAFGGLAATNVILGGAAAVEHGDNLTNEQLQLMKDKGMFLVGTDWSYDNFFSHGIGEKEARALTDAVVDRLKRAYEIGTPMAFGTDVTTDLPGLNRIQSTFKVLETWKAAGIPPSYILQTMTINAAELLGIEQERGVLEPSYYADIVAMTNNPLIDIEAIKTVHFVMKEGEVIRYDEK